MEDWTRIVELQIGARAEHLRHIRGAVQIACEVAGVSEAVTQDLVLAVNEACMNVIQHGYQDRTDGRMVLEVGTDGRRLRFCLTDFAPAVDVAQVRPRELDDIRPGGLGTHFIREVMDEVRFDTPAGGGNRLEMIRRIG